MEFFSCASTTYDGDAYRDGVTEKIHNPNLSIYGTSTPDDFWSSLTSSRASDGFLPRFLLLSPADTDKVKFQYEAPREEVRRATIGPDGNPTKPAGTEIHDYYGREIVITPRLEMREVVVSRTYARPPRYEHPLDDVRLPAGFAKNGKWHWPRS